LVYRGKIFFWIHSRILAPIEKYDRFSMTMSDRAWMKKIAKIVFWKGVLISTNKPVS
jgi:hypothetical protein